MAGSVIAAMENGLWADFLLSAAFHDVSCAQASPGTER